MLLFNADGKQIQIEREGFEATAQNMLLDQVDKMRKEKPGMYSMLKGALNTASMFGVEFPFEIPQGVNPIEFILCWGIKVGLDMLENKPIPVAAKVVNLNEQADTDKAR